MNQQQTAPGRRENTLGWQLAAAGSLLIGIALLLVVVLLALLPSHGLTDPILGGSLGCFAILLVGFAYVWKKGALQWD